MTKTPRQSRPGDEPLSDLQEQHLLFGRIYFGWDGTPDQFPFEDDAHRRRLWEQHRESLIEQAAPHRVPKAMLDYEDRDGGR